MSDRICRCCGVGNLQGVRARLRVCLGCDDCDGLHGDALQAILVKATADRKMSGDAALARALIDDAQLTGRAVYFENPPGSGQADMRIPDPPPRWLVVCARALCRKELPDMHSVVGAVLGRFMGLRSSQTVLEAMRVELQAALSFIDASIFDVQIDTKVDVLDSQHLIIQVQAKTPALGAVVTPGTENVEIPPDILLRKRAEA
jgi:hypothetical protein